MEDFIVLPTMSRLFNPGKLYPILSLFDLIEHEKSFSKAMTQEDKQAKASEIIKNHVGFSLGAALVPLPGVDLLAVSGVQLNMLRQLAKLYQVSFFDHLAKSLISAIAGGGAARLGASLIKAIPGVGTVVGELSMPILSGASTWALGRTVAAHFQKGGSLEDLDITNARKKYKTEMEEGKKVAEELRTNEGTRTESDTALEKIKKLAEMKEAGILSEEEFQQLKTRLLEQI